MEEYRPEQLFHDAHGSGVMDFCRMCYTRVNDGYKASFIPSSLPELRIPFVPQIFCTYHTVTALGSRSRTGGGVPATATGLVVSATGRTARRAAAGGQSFPGSSLSSLPNVAAASAHYDLVGGSFGTGKRRFKGRSGRAGVFQTTTVFERA